MDQQDSIFTAITFQTLHADLNDLCGPDPGMNSLDLTHSLMPCMLLEPRIRLHVKLYFHTAVDDLNSAVDHDLGE